MFERDNPVQNKLDAGVYHFSRKAASPDIPTAESTFYCKLTDFGVLRLPDGGMMLGGSRPWQAPECSRGAYFKIEEAKRTDIYSFGMLLWRVFLDGDPFKTLGEFDGKTDKERRQKRNDAVAALKEDDRLVQHVCSSLALSERFSRPCLEMLCEVISITLVTDSSRRELDLARIIRLLTPNNWYQARHPVAPARLPFEIDAHLLDLEKWHSEFDKASPVVQKWIASGFSDYAEGRSDDSEKDYEEKRVAAAYQLAICYANGFGVAFQPDECLRWLAFAAEGGSQKAQEALPKIAQVLNKPLLVPAFHSPWVRTDDTSSELSSSWASEFPDVSRDSPVTTSPPQWTFLTAAEGCRYDILETLLSNATKPTTSGDGVSPLHFLSSWDVRKAESLGRRLVAAGADINAQAKRGSTIGGTPLMWSVFGDHLPQTSVLIKLGADPMAATDNGDDALLFAAKLHLTAHLRLLMENIRPARVRGHLSRLVEAAVGGESRFTRMSRHGQRWKTAATETLQFLQAWNTLFCDAEDFRSLLVPALEEGLKSPYGRMNTDVQMAFITRTAVDPAQLGSFLRDSVMTWNEELFAALLDYGVPITDRSARNKSLLHLCAKIPDHSLAATAFAPRLLNLGAEIESRDDNGITPWMDAILERKWDLADLLMKQGANALATDREGFNVLGLCIKAVNLGSIKYLMKYCAQKTKFHQDSFLVNTPKQISAVQLAAAIRIPRAHGMKIEVIGTFLTVLANFALEPEQLNFRSDGLLPNATALDIAASKGNVHAVKNLCKKGAHLKSGQSACTWAASAKRETTGYLQKKNLERCIFIIENWDDDRKQTRRLADDWTNMKTIDESNVNSSWEIVVFDYKSRKALATRVRE